MLQRQDLFADERFATNAWRVANRMALDAEIEPVFAAIDREEAIRRLTEAQIAWGRVSGIHDLPHHEALRRTDIELPNGKRIAVPRPAGRDGFDAIPKVPALGADTDRIRSEFTA